MLLLAFVDCVIGFLIPLCIYKAYTKRHQHVYSPVSLAKPQEFKHATLGSAIEIEPRKKSQVTLSPKAALNKLQATFKKSSQPADSVPVTPASDETSIPPVYKLDSIRQKLTDTLDTTSISEINLEVLPDSSPVLSRDKWKIVLTVSIDIADCVRGQSIADRYEFEEHLPDIGGRKSKKWAYHYVGPESKKMLFTSSPVSKLCTLKFPRSIPTLNKLLKLVRTECQYIHPIKEVMYAPEYNHIWVVQTFMPLGSLKDEIYKSERPDLLWDKKYSKRSRGLSMDRVKLFGRQMLEALLYLYEKGFPPLGNVQSGNVFLVEHNKNEVCKLGGYDNTLLGYKSRLQKLYKDRPKHIDVLMFGHLVFEMAAGYELTTTEPTDEDYEQLSAKKNSEEITFELRVIFSQTEIDKFPTIRQISEKPVFQNVAVTPHKAPKPNDREVSVLLHSVRSGKPADNKPIPVKNEVIESTDKPCSTSRKRTSSLSRLPTKKSPPSRQRAKSLPIPLLPRNDSRQLSSAPRLPVQTDPPSPQMQPAGSTQQDAQLSQPIAITMQANHSTFTPGPEDVESEGSVIEAASVREDTSKFEDLSSSRERSSSLSRVLAEDSPGSLARSRSLPSVFRSTGSKVQALKDNVKEKVKGGVKTAGKKMKGLGNNLRTKLHSKSGMKHSTSTVSISGSNT